VNVFVLLPATGGSIYAVSEIVLVKIISVSLREISSADLSVLVCGDVCPLELGLASTSASTDGFKHG
jgi:hypothetical protein